MIAQIFLLCVASLAVVNSTPDWFDGGNFLSDGFQQGVKTAQDTLQQGQKVLGNFMKGGTEQAQKNGEQENKTGEDTFQQGQKSLDDGGKPAEDANKDLVKQGKKALEGASKAFNKAAKGGHEAVQRKGNS